MWRRLFPCYPRFSPLWRDHDRLEGDLPLILALACLGAGVYPNVDTALKQAGRCVSRVFFAKSTMSEAPISTPSPVALQDALGLVDSDPATAGSASAPRFADATTASAEWSLLSKVFSFPAMLAAFLVGAVFAVGRTFSVDPDLWWHIKTGEILLNTHRWPTVDAYSFTVPGQPWIAGEWLADVLIAFTARHAGLQGLDALLIVLGSAIMLALYGYATLRSGNSKAGFVVATVLLVLANASFTLRPQMLGYLFLILTLMALERFRQGKQRAIWFLPALFLVWVNTHGSFAVGIGAIAVYLISGLFAFRAGGIEARRWTAEERVRLEGVLLLCVLGLAITPYGVRLALYPFHVASSLPVGVANVREWQSMPFNFAGGQIFLALVLVFFLTQIAFRFSLRLEEVVLVVGGIAMACLHLRFLLVFVPVFAPCFAVIVARWVPGYDRKKDRYALNAALIGLVLAGIVYYFPSRASLAHTVAAKFPVNAVQYLQQHPVAGPTFNSYGFGGYLVLAGQKVFVDGRADPYERGGSLADYFYVAQLQPGALTVLQNYGIQSCLLDRTEPLVTLLSATPQWQEIYRDGVSVLFVRRDNQMEPRTNRR